MVESLWTVYQYDDKPTPRWPNGRIELVNTAGKYKAVDRVELLQSLGLPTDAKPDFDAGCIVFHDDKCVGLLIVSRLGANGQCVIVPAMGYDTHAWVQDTTGKRHWFDLSILDKSLGHLLYDTPVWFEDNQPVGYIV